jgi:hypothetical protein
MAFAVIENFGYRQMLTFFRAQGVMRYFAGLRRWEIVTHKGAGEALAVADGQN